MGLSFKASLKRQTVSWPILIFFFLIIGVMVLHVLTVSHYPPVFVDEAFMISRAWTWLHTGLNFGPLDAGFLEKRFEGFWTFHPLIPTWFHSLFIQIFGLDLSLLRLASLLCGAVVLVAVFSISYQVSASSRCGFIAIFLVITSFSFALSAHQIRYDIIVAALSFSAIAIHLAAARKTSVVLSILSGLFLGFAFEVHVNAVIYVPVIVALFFAEEGLRFYRRRVFWGFVGGSAIALAWYLWQHVLQFPQAYFGIGRAMAGTHYPPLLLTNPLAFIMASAEIGSYLVLLTQFRIVATVIAAFVLWKSRDGTRPVLMLLIGIISFALLIKNKLDYYLILITPFSDIVLAHWIERFVFEKHLLSYWAKLGRALALSILTANVLFMVVTVLIMLKLPSPKESTSVAKRIERVIPKGGSVMGAQTYWFDLHQYRYLSWHNIPVYRLYVPESTFNDAMAAIKPDVFVIDDHLRQFILPEQGVIPRSGFDRYAWERRLPKDDIDAFLVRRAILKDRFETQNYGTVEIYLINWD